MRFFHYFFSELILLLCPRNLIFECARIIAGSKACQLFNSNRMDFLLIVQLVAMIIALGFGDSTVETYQNYLVYSLDVFYSLEFFNLIAQQSVNPAFTKTRNSVYSIRTKLSSSTVLQHASTTCKSRLLMHSYYVFARW